MSENTIHQNQTSKDVLSHQSPNDLGESVTITVSSAEANQDSAELDAVSNEVEKSSTEENLIGDSSFEANESQVITAFVSTLDTAGKSTYIQRSLSITTSLFEGEFSFDQDPSRQSKRLWQLETTDVYGRPFNEDLSVRAQSLFDEEFTEAELAKVNPACPTLWYDVQTTDPEELRQMQIGTQTPDQNLTAPIWPPAQALRTMLRCSNSECVCHRKNGPVHCPVPGCASNGRHPGLRLRQSDDGLQPLWYCAAGCPQRIVTSAIAQAVIFNLAPHRLFPRQPGSDPIIADTHFGHADAANYLTQNLPTPLQRGLNATTYAEFGLQYVIGRGVTFPSNPNSSSACWRWKGLYDGQPKSFWSEENPGHHAYSHQPVVYNLEVLDRPDLMKSGLYLVPTEEDVWFMQQNRLAAVSLLSEPHQYFAAADALAETMRNYMTYDLTVLCEDTPADRSRVEQVLGAFRNTNVDVQVRALLRTDRFVGQSGPTISNPASTMNVGDLFGACRYDSQRFRDAIATLALLEPNAVSYTPESFSLRQLLDPSSVERVVDEDFETLEISGNPHQIRAYDEYQLRHLPRPKYAIQGIVPKNGVTFVTGKHSLGKSAIILDMAASVSLGRPWQNKATGDQPALVFYIAAESFASVPDRLAAWRLARGIESTPLLRFISHPVLIHQPESLQSLVRYIRGVVEVERLKALANGAEPPEVGMIVIDTLACSIGNMEENSPSHMTAFTNAANKLSDLLNSSVVIVHHHGKNDEVRGASSLSSNASAMLTMSGRPGAERVTMEVTKMKEGRVGVKIPLHMRVITLPGQLDDYGEQVTSVVFDLDTERASEGNAEGDTMSDTEVTGDAKTGDEAGYSTRCKTIGSLSTKSAPGKSVGHQPSQPKPKYSEKELVTLEALKALRATHDAREAENGSSEWAGVSNGEWEAASAKLGVSRASYTRAKGKFIDDGLVICHQPNSPQARFALKIDPEIQTAGA